MSSGFRAWLRPWLWTAAGMLGIFYGARLFALFYYGPWQTLILEQRGRELIKGLLVGLRFDGVSISYALILPTLLLGLWIAAPLPALGRWLAILERGLFVALVFLYAAITAVDLGYYSYFQDHLNVLVFGFFDDDTWALVRTFWRNYPVPLILLGVGLFLGGLWRASRHFLNPDRYSWNPTPRWKSIPLAFVLFFSLGLGARGSVGLFPLHEIDAAVSQEPFVNYLGYPGLHGLYRAIKVRSLNNSVWNTNGLFYGFSSWQEAASVFYQKPIESLPADPLELLAQKTPPNPWAKATRPHVVVLLMESWGGYWMSYQSPSFNVLGSLQQHFKDDGVFLRFLPSMSATIGSLTALMVNSPHRPDGNFLSESRYMRVPFRFAPAPLFKRLGYRTRFIYGGGVAWRSVDRYATVQGFESIEGDYSVEKVLGRKVQKHDWGIYDGDLFEYLEKTLQEAKQPELVFLVTTTNHPPYEVPEGYSGPALDPPPELANRFTSAKSITAPRFRAFQYSNESLGRLMSSIKAGPLKDRVVLAATGDHGFFLVNFTERDLLQKWQVPFYLYVPEAGRPTKEQWEKAQSRFASHMDIFPTLYELVFSEQLHYSLGRSLFSDEHPDTAFHFSRLGISGQGAVLAEKKPQYFQWDPQAPDLRLKEASGSAELEGLHQRYRSLMGLLDYLYEFERGVHQRSGDNQAHNAE